MKSLTRRAFSTSRELLEHESTGGLVLIAASAVGLLLANSPLASSYNGVLGAYLGPLSIGHWINDGLMAVFFLLVGLEIKRELLDGQLSSWRRRILPGFCAAGGMIVPALVYLGLNQDRPEFLAGWAIPAATDIAFALGVLSLLGRRVSASLKLFLTALAIVDDLGAIMLIGLFYGGDINGYALGLAALVVALLVTLNRRGVTSLWPYALLGAALWVCVLNSGVHATVAGVVLAFCIPLKASPSRPDDLAASPLHRLEHNIQAFVGFIVLPIFGFANAGVSLAGLDGDAVLHPITFGVMSGLLLGKIVGVFGTAAIAIGLGIAELPSRATWIQLFGVSVLCGIGFTMSLFIGGLAFGAGSAELEASKIGVLLGSLIAAVAGWIILRLAPRTASG